jgi:hypothetical protein
MPTRTAAVVMLAAALAASGCISTANDRLVIDQNVALEAFQPVAPSGSTPAITQTSVGLMQPSITGVDRGNWPKTDFLVPVDGTAHNTIYAKRWLFADKTARQRGLYPTALSALEVTGGSESQQQIEVPANWLSSAGDILLMPFALFWQAPWTTRWSPDTAYARYWHPERPAAAAPEPAAPFEQPAPTPVTP